jgi:hypothetical protein
MQLVTAWLFCLLFTRLGYAQEPPATLYILRSTGAKAEAYSFSTFVNDSLFCKLNNKKFSAHHIRPGLNTIHAQYGGSDPKRKPERITIFMKPGQVYYVNLHLQQRFGGCDLVCAEITSSAARTLFKELKADTKCK